MLRNIRFYVCCVIGDEALAQEAATICCDQHIILDTDAAKVLVFFDLVKAEEILVDAFFAPVSVMAPNRCGSIPSEIIQFCQVMLLALAIWTLSQGPHDTLQ